MEKKEVLNELSLMVGQIAGADPFKGRARLLKSLTSLFDLVDRHKTSNSLSKICLSQARLLIRTFQEELNGKKKEVN